MRLVIDSNRLQSQELRRFLTKSTKNQAVLTDFAAMEAYKGDTLISIFKSLEVVSGFPYQVVILKGSERACAQSGRRKGLQRRLVDEPQTRGFPLYVKALRQAQAGNIRGQRQLLANGKSAQEHLDKMLRDAEEIGRVFEVLGNAYAKEERAILRDRGSYTPAMIDKLAKTLIEIAGLLFQDSRLVRRIPSLRRAAQYTSLSTGTCMLFDGHNARRARWSTVCTTRHAAK